MSCQKQSLIIKLSIPNKSGDRAKASQPNRIGSVAVLRPEASINSDILTYITRSQLALAISLLKSKPEDLSIKEYCEQLRNNIKSGRRPSITQLRHVDTCEFWKDHCSKIHLEKKALEDRLRCAEEFNRLLRQSLKPKTGSSGEEDEDGMSDLDLDAPSTSRKRPLSNLEDGSVDETRNSVLAPRLEDDRLLRLTSYAIHIKRQRRQLKTACKDSNTLDQINQLANLIIHMLKLLNTSFFDCCLPFHLLDTMTKENHVQTSLQRIMDLVGLSYLDCFKALDELCRTIPGRAKKSEIVYNLVIFFKKSLDFLQSVSNLQAEYTERQNQDEPRLKRPRLDGSEYVVNKYLSRMLSSILHKLEWNIYQNGHSDLLDGILFSILEKTGRLISEAVFDEHVALSDEPSNITKDGSVPRGSKEAARIESRYIVQILYAALGGIEKKALIDQMLSGSRTANAQTGRGSPSRGVTAGNLFLKTKQLLQSTLMKSAVGDEPFGTLRMPTPPVERNELEVVKDVGADVERYGADWLIESVWALVGWDLVT